VTDELDATNPKNRVLLVDDEKGILDGLRRMLRRHRDRYEFTFLDSPVQAAALVQESPFDVIITDMRMPEMNGVELLERVRDVCPSCVRIILSGHGELSAIMKSVGPSHQFLSKPCDADTILNSIDRACRMRRVLNRPELLQTLGGIETLPTLPDIYRELVKALQEEASLREIGEIIARDIALSAKMLQLVNSSYFGLSQEITDPGRAVMLLGGETISTLVLGTKIFEQIPTFKNAEFTAEQLLAHSSHVAVLADRFCRLEETSDVFRSQATTAGFLHDLGLLTLAAYRPKDLADSYAHARKHGCSLAEAEREIFGATHNQISGYLAGLWNFPDAVVEGVLYSNCPSESGNLELAPLSMVHAAEAFSRGVRKDRDPERVLDTAYYEGLQIEDRVSEWRKAAFELEERDP